MGEKSSTNVYWYVLIGLIVVLFVSATQKLSTAQLYNPEINGSLTNESIEQILRINGIDISEFEASKSEIEQDDAFGQLNGTGSQAKDFALEFFYARSSASRLGVTVKNIFSLPSYIMILLNIPENAVSWLISILNWFWRISILIATYYFIRGIK